MQSPRSPIEPVADRVLVHRADLDATAATVFGLFTTAAGLQSWLCRRAIVEPSTGGRYELFWDVADPHEDSTIGCRITAIEPDRILAFQWRSPRQYKHFANVADPLTHVFVAFHPTDAGCRISLVHSGWRSTPDWQQAADWQAKAWEHALQSLVARARQAASEPRAGRPPQA